MLALSSFDVSTTILVAALVTGVWTPSVWCVRILMSVTMARCVTSCVSTPPGVITAHVTLVTSSPRTTPPAETLTSAPGRTGAAVTSAQIRVDFHISSSNKIQCLISAGSFKCECPDGWELGTDEKTVRLFLASTDHLHDEIFSARENRSSFANH